MNRSQELYHRALQAIPAGVNSPVRAFKAVGGNPLFFKRGQAAYLFDADNQRYIDYVGSWGPLILGHAHANVIKAVHAAVDNGLSFGASTEAEVLLAEKISQLMPNIELVRLVNSGTEATMSAIRLARGYTGRHKIIKFEGCYHGHVDSLLVKAGSGALTFGTPTSAGLPKEFAQHTLVAQFNDLSSVADLFDDHGQDIAAIILEPVAGNMSCVPPMPGFLQGLRNLCDDNDSLLIFDEVMTGFRVGLGGAQEHYDIKPDLTTLGKIIGGGLPVGAFGGRKDIMQEISPLGPVYQAGTLSGNPIAVAAGLTTLEEIAKPDFYEILQAITNRLASGLQQRAEAAKIPLVINHIGSMFGLFFTDQPAVTNFSQVMNCSNEQYCEFFQHMLKQGVYFAPSAYETAFLSAAHTEADLKQTLTAFDVSCVELKQTV